MKVLKLLGLVNGQPSPFDDRYVVDCDTEAMAMLVTEDPAKARRFADAGAALDYWQRRSVERPTRPDGKPNRPLMAYSVLVEPAPVTDD